MSTSSEELALTYQEKTDIEHILDAPDTYIGSIELDSVKNWVMDAEDNMRHTNYDLIGGLYKCFDEGIVNCRDHAVRLMQKILNKEKKIIPVRNIDITVDKDTGVITMMNDGNGVDVVKHPENKLWVPEMIFGHLRTSTNYKKDEKKIVGGKNGFGFKLVLIYSKWGEIETVDHIRGKKYTQRFENNLTDILKPTIRKSKSKQEDLLNDLKESLKSTTDETSLIFSSLIEVLDSTLNDEETIRQTKEIVDNLIFDYNKTVQDTSVKIKNLQQIKYHYLEEE